MFRNKGISCLPRERERERDNERTWAGMPMWSPLTFGNMGEESTGEFFVLLL